MMKHMQVVSFAYTRLRLAFTLAFAVAMLSVSFLLPHQADAATCTRENTSGCTAEQKCKVTGQKYDTKTKKCVYDASACMAAGGTPVGDGDISPRSCSFTSKVGCETAGGTWNNAGHSCTAGAIISDQAAAGCNNSNKPRFLGLVPWYEYMTIAPDVTGGCAIQNFNNSDGDSVLSTQKDASGTKNLYSTSPILLIVLAILNDLIRIAALVAVGFIIAGGFEYMTSQGSPDSTKQAQQTIINALIGLVIALVAVGLVSFIGNRLGTT